MARANLSPFILPRLLPAKGQIQQNMRQLTQQLKTGELRIHEVPARIRSNRCMLVRNHFSLISAGTEGSTVKTARKSLLAKGLERPQQVRQVLDVVQKQGPVQAYRAVVKKLDA